MTLITKPGIYAPDHVSADAYHADPCFEPSLSRSVLVTLLERSPRHAWMQHPRLNPDYQEEDKLTFDLGKAAHALLLQGEDVVTVIDADSYRTNAAKDARDAARAAGLVPLLPDDAAEVRAMVKSCRAQLQHHPDGADAFTGQPEMTLATVDKDFGFWCRIRVDDLPANSTVFYDYKTTTDASPDVWPRRAFDHNLHIQEAFYARIIQQVTGIYPKFRFVVQEVKPPYALAIYEFDPEARTIARTRMEEGMRRWHWCLSRNHWGGYYQHIHTIDTPPWIGMRHESEKLRAETVQAETDKSLFEAALAFQAPHEEAAE